MENVDRFGRKTWDKSTYDLKAKELAKQEKNEVQTVEDIDAILARNKKKFVPAELRTNLRVEDRKIEDINAKVNERKIVNATTSKRESGGFYCEVCHCILKDSLTYLDHINGWRHQKMIGMRMTVDRVGISSIKERLEKQKAQQLQSSLTKPPTDPLDDIVPGTDNNEEEEDDEESNFRKAAARAATKVSPSGTVDPLQEAKLKIETLEEEMENSKKRKRDQKKKKENSNGNKKPSFFDNFDPSFFEKEAEGEEVEEATSSHE